MTTRFCKRLQIGGGKSKKNPKSQKIQKIPGHVPLEARHVLEFVNREFSIEYCNQPTFISVICLRK
jgi:hypothetical protein